MFEYYHREVERTSIHGLSSRDRLLLGSIGLCGEAGEVAERVKKHVFHGEPLERQALILELGDVLWYLTHLASDLNASLEDVASANVEKLSRRYPGGFPR
jgi:NTP pyrophosphatase (non-canonical NTP hydrolase)